MEKTLIILCNVNYETHPKVSTLVYLTKMLRYKQNSVLRTLQNKGFIVIMFLAQSTLGNE